MKREDNQTQVERLRVELEEELEILQAEQRYRVRSGQSVDVSDVERDLRIAALEKELALLPEEPQAVPEKSEPADSFPSMNQITVLNGALAFFIGFWLMFSWPAPLPESRHSLDPYASLTDPKSITLPSKQPKLPADDCEPVVDEEFRLSNELSCGDCIAGCREGLQCVQDTCIAKKAPPPPATFVPIACSPSAEFCDNIDNDCNGEIDDGFNLQVDPNNCGICGRNCATGQRCENGHCTLSPF